jgi:hypothetical protein
MTDTFSSGFSAPFDSGQEAGEPAGEVTSTLAELERKLRELERELTSIGRRRVRPEAPVAQAPTTAAASADSAEMGRLMDEQVEFHRAAPPPPPPPPPPSPSPPPPYPPPPPRAATPPPPPPPPAPRAAAMARESDDEERPRPTEAQLASLAELRRFRERLERFTRELLADYDAVLSRAMSGVAGRVPSEPAAPLPAMTGQAPPPPPAAPQAPPQPREQLYEGRVELGVGPFYDIGSLGAFEQLVAEVPQVMEVSVRRFEASHAVVDVRLASPVALVSELRRVLNTDFSARQVAPGRIQLAFDDA